MLLPLLIKLDFSDRATNTHPSGKLPCHKSRCLNHPHEKNKVNIELSSLTKTNYSNRSSNLCLHSQEMVCLTRTQARTEASCAKVSPFLHSRSSIIKNKTKNKNKRTLPSPSMEVLTVT